MSDTWSGRKVTAARAVVAGWLAKGPMPCTLCGDPVTLDEPWVVGHIKPRSTHPELTWRQDNWGADHRRCSDASGQAAVIEKARAEGRASIFPHSQGTGQTRPLTFLSPQRSLPKPLEIRSELQWTQHTQNAPTWLQPLLAVPSDASVPLAMTPVHPEAVDSYGWDVCAWAENQLGIKLRWWQQLCVVRQLEHRLDGSLCWRSIVESAPRRSGKSTRLQVMALSRMSTDWGELQTVVHTASDMAIAREVQRRIWRWAEEEAEWRVSRSNGKEAVESEDGNRWLIRAQTAVYGYDASLAVCDEAWDVNPETVDEGLEPAMLERISPQLVLTSTAHRRATSLMRKRLASALAQDDGETLLLLWGARPQDDYSDPDVWRAASPHWTDDRARMIAAKYAKALAGEDDPELDDPDPMAGFASQFLNVWRLSDPPAEKGDPLTTQDAWEDLRTEAPERAPDAVAVESWFAEGVSVARAWTEGVVDVEDYPDVATAAAVVRAEGASIVIVGASLADDPSWQGVRLTRGQGRTASAVQDLSRFIQDGALQHAGSEHLTTQILAVRTTPSTDGVRLSSRGRADAVKAAAWALGAARKKPRQNPRPRLLLPSAS